MTTMRWTFQFLLWGSVTGAFTIATALALGDTVWLWVSHINNLLPALHDSIDPLMLAFLFGELAHTARVMQSAHEIRPELIAAIAALASVRHLLVVLTINKTPTLDQILGSGSLTVGFVAIWMGVVYIRRHLNSSYPTDKRDEA